jgi:hypothetical protein
VKHTLTCLAVAVALLAVGCSSGDTPSSSLPMAPSSPLVTENFSGTVQVGSSDSHPFTVISDGFQITIDLTTAGPPSTITMGFGVGSMASGSCQPLSGGSTSASAGPTPQLSGNIAAGSYCLAVFDIGNQSAPITYTVVVNHY